MRWVYWRLSTSAFVRKEWAVVVKTSPMAGCTPEAVVVRVLEAFVRQYMRSRIKTHRIHSGLTADSSGSSGIRALLKSSALAGGKHAAATAHGNRNASALTACIGYWASQVPVSVRQYSNKAMVVLLATDHGLTFESIPSPTAPVGTGLPVPSVLRVASVPVKYNKLSICGDVMVGDIVFGMRQYRSKEDGGLFKIVSVDLSKENASNFPLHLELSRTPQAVASASLADAVKRSVSSLSVQVAVVDVRVIGCGNCGVCTDWAGCDVIMQ